MVDFNSTQALVSPSFRVSSSFGDFDEEILERENTTWVPLSEIGLMNSFEDLDLINIYESTVDIAAFGTRNCMVYKYVLSYEVLLWRYMLTD